jgi:hypothetical protein
MQFYRLWSGTNGSRFETTTARLRPRTERRSNYSTVTDLARFRGLSTSLPRSRAAW